MKQISTSEIVNFAHQVVTQNPNSKAFFSSQCIRDNLHQVDEDVHFESADKLLVDFYNATHATVESYQSLFEVQKKINEDNERIAKLQKELSDLESDSKAYLESDPEFNLSLLQQTEIDFNADENFKALQQEILMHQENLKKIEDLKASLEEITNSEEYHQNSKRIEQFESEIKKAEDALTKILSVDFDKKKQYDMEGSVFIASISFGLCLFLAGLAAMSYFSPAAIAGIMACLAGGIPLLVTIALSALALVTTVVIAPIVLQFFGAASIALGLLTYKGVYIAAPFFGHAFAGMSVICLVTAIIAGIHALVLKRTNHDDFIKQNIQPKIEEHINFFQKNTTSEMEKTNDKNFDAAQCNLKIA